MTKALRSARILAQLSPSLSPSCPGVAATTKKEEEAIFKNKNKICQIQGGKFHVSLSE